jgi:hypothetical protein
MTELQERQSHVNKIWNPYINVDYPKFQESIIDNFQKGLVDELTFEKAYNKLNEMFIKGKDLSKLTKKVIWVQRGGKTFQLTTYIDDETKEEENPIGYTLSPDILGMRIKRYSDKALLITGNTFVNVDLLREIKSKLNVGIWNNSLKGWIFPLDKKEEILAHIWTKAIEKDENLLAESILSQKNTIPEGSKVINDNKEAVIVDVKYIEPIKYEIKTDEGIKEVKETEIKIEPEKDDNKIVELISKVTPENRNTTELLINGMTDKPKTIEQVVKAEYEKSEIKSEEKKAKVTLNGKEYEVDDYSGISALEIVMPKEKTILGKPKPQYIPNIDEKEFKRHGLFFDALKISDDKYLVALDNYKREGIKNRYANGKQETYSVETVKDSNLCVMSLDLLAVTTKYYRSKLKAENTIFYKERGSKAKRLSSLSDTRANYSHMDMFSDFNSLTPNIYRSSKEPFWVHKRQLNEDLKQKSIDMELQLEDLENAHKKGEDTSYGDKGTKDVLLKDYGVKVKRQNGDVINTTEINQIKTALDDVFSVFGNRKQMSEKFNLKISHSGNMNMHARKASGLFYPSYNAIGVSFGKTENNYSHFVLSHEYGHFMDYWIGKQTGNHYASDKQGSIANELAKVFGKNMNKKTESAYWGRTCEKLARSLEQYSAYKIDQGSYTGYTNDDNYVSKEKFETHIVPLVEKFLSENNELLKSIQNDLK